MITVLMPVFNDDRFELLVIDDGSTALDPAPALGNIWRKAVGPQVRRLAYYSEMS